MSKGNTALIIILLIGIVIVGGLFIGKSNSPLTSKSTTTTKSRGNKISDPVENTEIERYVLYSPQVVENTKDKKKVLYFWAVWCPTCKIANAEFINREDEIPEDVVVFKVNYDTETELKKKYNITYQHTFVYIDDNGNEITQWNGGGIRELLTYLQ